jgi:hypothetical protein
MIKNTTYSLSCIILIMYLLNFISNLKSSDLAKISLPTLNYAFQAIQNTKSNGNGNGIVVFVRQTSTIIPLVSVISSVGQVASSLPFISAISPYALGLGLVVDSIKQDWTSVSLGTVAYAGSQLGFPIYLIILLHAMRTFYIFFNQKY